MPLQYLILFAVGVGICLVLLLILTKHYGLSDTVNLAKKNIMDHIKEGLIVVDTEYNVLYVNDTAKNRYSSIMNLETEREALIQMIKNRDGVLKKDGFNVEIRVSELLEEKKAVVLNFWYLNCNPCRMEFPYLKEAYAEYKDEIEVIAVNPYDGTTETVADYQKELALDFPMAAIDYEWQEVMNITAYPMTVVIDRYGTIAFIHKAAITETETFTTIFEYFTADDYKQTTIRNVEDILK